MSGSHGQNMHGINRIIGDVLGIVVIIAIFFIGAVVISQLNSTSLLPAGSGLTTSVNNMITNYGTAGTLIGLVIIVILLRDAIGEVRQMGNGGA